MLEHTTCTLLVHIKTASLDALTLPCLIEIENAIDAKISIPALWFARHLQSRKEVSYPTLTKYMSAVALLRDFYFLFLTQRLSKQEVNNTLLRCFLDSVDNGSCLGWKIPSNKKYHEIRNAIQSFASFTQGIRLDIFCEQDKNFITACITSSTIEKQLTSSRLYNTFHRRRKRAHSKSSDHHQYFDSKPFPPNLVKPLISLTKNPRDKFLWSMMAYSGKRISEYVLLFLDDVSFRDGELQIYFRHPKDFKMKWHSISGKIRSGTRAQYLREVYNQLPRTEHGNMKSAAGWKGMAFDDEAKLQSEAYFIHDAGAELLEMFRIYTKKFLALTPPKNHPYLLSSKSGKPLTISAIEKQFRLACARVEKAFGIDLKSYGPHSLRHYYGFYCVDVLRLELNQVSKLMHHVFISSTSRYAKISNSTARTILKQAHDKSTDKTKSNPSTLSQFTSENRISIMNSFVVSKNI